MSTYEDLLVTDIERIQRAKEILKRPDSNRRDKVEAIQLMDLYSKIARTYIEIGNEEQKERAREIRNELGRNYR